MFFPHRSHGRPAGFTRRTTPAQAFEQYGDRCFESNVFSHTGHVDGGRAVEAFEHCTEQKRRVGTAGRKVIPQCSHGRGSESVRRRPIPAHVIEHQRPEAPAWTAKDSPHTSQSARGRRPHSVQYF